MVVYIEGNDAYYSVQWLASCCRRHGMTIGNVDEADVLLVTVSDVEDLKVLRRIRKEANGRPVIVGGLGAASGNGLALAWADAVVLGEGEEFLAALGDGGLDYALALPCVVTKSEPFKAARPSTLIDFNASPVVQVTSHCWYALAARGCPNHCNFCMTSWATKHQRASDARLEAVTSAVLRQDPRAQITYITNYSQGLPAKRKGAQSFLLREYIAHPDAAKGLTLVRVGVEGMTEARRAWFGKSITDDELRACITLAREKHQQLELFFIVGWPECNDEWEQLCETCLPLESRKGCHLWAKFTYFNACPLTPMARYDVTTLRPFDTAKAFRLAMARTQRYHDHPIQALTKALWRTVLHRALWRDADAVPLQAPRCDHEQFIGEVQKRGLGYTLAPTDSDVLPGEHLDMWNHAARDKRRQQIVSGEPASMPASEGA